MAPAHSSGGKQTRSKTEPLPLGINRALIGVTAILKFSQLCHTEPPETAFYSRARAVRTLPSKTELGSDTILFCNPKTCMRIPTQLMLVLKNEKNEKYIYSIPDDLSNMRTQSAHNHHHQSQLQQHILQKQKQVSHTQASLNRKKASSVLEKHLPHAFYEVCSIKKALETE